MIGISVYFIRCRRRHRTKLQQDDIEKDVDQTSPNIDSKEVETVELIDVETKENE